MSVRRLALTTLIGVMALPGFAYADEVAIAPPPTIAQDKSDPVCKTSLVHCDQTDFKDNPQDIVDQTRAVAPTLRTLRRCLDKAGFAAVDATIRIKLSGRAPVIQVPQALEQNACIIQARTKLDELRTETPVALACTYDCLGGPINGPPPPIAKPPPLVAPPPTSSSSAVPPREPPKDSSASTWYGWQTLIADAASATVLAIGLGSWTYEPTIMGYSGFLLGTPILHAVHGNYGRAIGSFGLRLLLPTVVGGIAGGLNVAANGPEKATPLGVVTTAGIGIGVAAAACILIDLSFLAWETPEREKRTGSLR